ncbi:hypothetical protein HHK36_011746 [Tetracentron sinense]|uniref:NTF2 domain-containing protein n=1 Tax=Tetracentron sinense TaxID=13715 RepID=A0A834ZJ68_TETSI|nr:hypothetical protein HHK36_011746 [Tetracentron sinense]
MLAAPSPPADYPTPPLNILAKLTSLPFQQCQHNITTVDCQPSVSTGGMVFFVNGNLQLAGDQHSLEFSQGFHLLSKGNAKPTTATPPAISGELRQQLSPRLASH